MDILRDETPLGRIGTSKDISNAVEFLISDKASFITAQVLGVNGGFGI
ncbi:MAG: SDR family oxidoreductase [Pseudoruminococcus massiliensis]